MWPHEKHLTFAFFLSFLTFLFYKIFESLTGQIKVVFLTGSVFQNVLPAWMGKKKNICYIVWIPESSDSDLRRQRLTVLPQALYKSRCTRRAAPSPPSAVWAARSTPPASTSTTPTSAATRTCATAPRPLLPPAGEDWYWSCCRRSPCCWLESGSGGGRGNLTPGRMWKLSVWMEREGREYFQSFF